jgi:hypothetical protein
VYVVLCASTAGNWDRLSLLLYILYNYILLLYYTILYIIILLLYILYNRILKHVIEGKIKGGIEVTGRQGRRRRKLLDDLKERRGYCHSKEEALDHTVWKAGFGRGFGPVVRMNEY